MLITDYSEQNFETKDSTIPFIEVITAGMIFVLPIVFLLLISVN